MRSLYDDPVAYDLIHNHNTGDLPFYMNQIRHYGKRVLELGCGTGRLTIPLALAGFDITGIDIDENMLSLARDKAARSGVEIEWHQADVRGFELGKQFDVIFFPANSISHLLDNDSIEACLQCVKKHLTDSGRFIFQTFNPYLPILMRDPNQRYSVAEYESPDGRGLVTVTENNLYDRALQVNTVKWYYSFQNLDEEIVAIMPLRMIFSQELDLLLRHNGYKIVDKFGGFDASAFKGESAHQILVCQKD